MNNYYFFMKSEQIIAIPKLNEQEIQKLIAVSDPEKFTNVKHIITDDCHLIIGIESQTKGSIYYECPNPADSSKIIVIREGDILK